MSKTLQIVDELLRLQRRKGPAPGLAILLIPKSGPLKRICSSEDAVGKKILKTLLKSSNAQVLEWYKNHPEKRVNDTLGLETSGLFLTDRKTNLVVHEDVFHGLHIVRGLLEILLDNDDRFSFRFELSEKGLESLLSGLIVILSWKIEHFVKKVKLFSQLWIALYMKQEELPLGVEVLGDGLLFSGPVRRYIRNRLARKNKRNYLLFYSILQIKRAAAVVPKAFIQNALETHRSSLSKIESFSWADQVEVEPYLTRIWSSLKPEKVAKSQLYEISTSASFKSTRNVGGARQELRELMLSSGFSGPDELLSMREERPGQVREYRGVYFPNLATLVRMAKEDTSVSTTVVPILEPLKVRIITKGNALKNWIAKTCQKSMHTSLRNTFQFSLIGTPLSEPLLDELLLRSDSYPELVDASWVSGDYSAATDNMKIGATKLAFELFLDRTYGPYSDISDVFREVLYEQLLHYPKGSGLEPVMQTTGQLMGSPLSFPILCIINLAIYWQTFEQFLGRKVGFSSLPVLINGDDILFKATPEFYKLWLRNIELVGLQTSPGKNYFHKEYFTVNSQACFQSGGKCHLKKFFNVGLLTGQSKISGRDDVKTRLFSDIFSELGQGSQNCNRAWKRFVHYNLNDVVTGTHHGKISPFAPLSLGGLGVDRDLSSKISFHFTFYQKAMAYFFKGIHSSGFEGKAKSTSMGVVKLVEDEEQIGWFNPTTSLSVNSLKSNLIPERTFRISYSPRIGPLLEGQVRQAGLIDQPRKPLGSEQYKSTTMKSELFSTSLKRQFRRFISEKSLAALKAFGKEKILSYDLVPVLNL